MSNKYIYIVAKLEEVHNNSNSVCITQNLSTRYMPVFNTYYEAMQAYPNSTILSILWDESEQSKFVYGEG